MPRRPSKKPAPKKPRGVKRSDASIRRWDKPSDIPIDEEDQFHASRDRILLEGEEEGRDDDGDEDEVFALKGVANSSEDEDEDEDMEDYDEDDAPVPAPSSKKSKAKAKAKKAAVDESASDVDDDEEEEEGWGTKKSAYYASNVDDIESDDEEANEMEEQEARRLQAKARDVLQEDDFGLADASAQGSALDADVFEDLTETPTPVVQALPKDKQALLRHLEKTTPESLALARDWEDVAWNIVKTQQKLEKMAADPSQDTLSLGMVHLHHQALLTYGTTLAFYLHLRASPRYTQNPALLRAHPILKRLLTLKQSLSTLEELDFALSDEEEDEDREDLSDSESELEDLDDDDLLPLAAEPSPPGKTKKKGLDVGELEALLMDAEGVWGREPNPRKNTSKPATNGTAPAALTTTVSEPPKKKRKTAAPVFDLVEPSFAPSSSSSARVGGAAADAYGEPATLAAADAQDKRARRKSLQFYAARVENASARRAGARAAAGGGDDDIPYRGRERREKGADKQRGMGGADLDGEEPDMEKGRKRAREEEEEGEGGEEEDGDGYYSLVKRKVKEKKELKKAEYEAAQAAARPQTENVGAEGPRTVSRAILKNKGLTPHRSKSVRNPRVKKRMRFDRAQKKLSSQKAVFKSGVDASRYEGERSGISKVVKSVRL